MKVLTAVLMAALVLTPRVAPAEEPTICVTQVEASGTAREGKAAEVDAKLEKVRKRLPHGFAAYKFLGQECWVLAVAQTQRVGLPDAHRLIVTRLESEPVEVRLRWSLLQSKDGREKPLMEESVAALGNGGFLWIGGPRVDSGSLFVLLHAHWEG